MIGSSIVVIGDSHVYAIKAALAKDAPEQVSIEALRLASKKGDQIIGDLSLEDALDYIAPLGPGNLLALVIRGNHYNTLGLMQHPQPFDFLLPGLEQPSDNVELIPCSLMRDFFASTLTSGYGKIYAKLAQASSAPVVCLEVPAPKKDAAHIMKGAESYFVARGITEVGVTPASIRLKLWSFQQEALQAFCAERGIRYLPSPSGTRDPEGFLERAYYAPDATHANAAYGALVLRQLEELVMQRAETAEEVGQ